MRVKLPKYFTKVTPLSKTLALILFISLPIVAFFIGIQYEKIIQQSHVSVTSIIGQPSPTNIQIRNAAFTYWKIFSDQQNIFSFFYPPEYEIVANYRPTDKWKNSWIIINNKQSYEGYTIYLIILQKQEFEVRTSDQYQEVVYSKQLEINGLKAMQQILVGKDIHADDSTAIITQIKDNSGKYIISFSTGLYKLIKERNIDYNSLKEKDYEEIIQKDLSVYNKIVSSVGFK